MTKTKPQNVDFSWFLRVWGPPRGVWEVPLDKNIYVKQLVVDQSYFERQVLIQKKLVSICVAVIFMHILGIDVKRPPA